MLLPTVLLLLSVIAPMPGPEHPSSIAAVPDEPGTVVLPDASILQTVAADVDEDGRREVVRLVRGDGEAVLAEVWGQDAATWRMRGEPVEVVPPSRVGTRIDPVYQSTPVRLLVRRVDGAERVTVASQPHFEQIDVGPPCCLILHDLAIDGGSAVRRSVSGPSDFSTAVLVIDFDGDGTDELLSTLSLPPAGDISYPIEARVHRWDGAGFADPTVTLLPVGSGDSPIRLADSDGVPGDEAAIISTLGPPGVFRIRLAADDQLALDAGGITVDQAVAVPLDAGRGIAVVGPVVGLMVAAWPPGEPVSAPVAQSLVRDGRIVGSAIVDARERLVVHEPDSDALHLLGLPDLLPPQGVTITRSPAAAALSGLPLVPFTGLIPGGGANGEPAVIHAGRLIPSLVDGDRSGTAIIATLAGAHPVGLAGDRDLLVLHHGGVGPPVPDADGGSFSTPTPLDQAWTSIAPFELTRQPEPDDGALEPSLRGAIRLDARDGIAVGRSGFTAEVRAPPGSRVAVATLDPSVIRTPVVVPASGRIDAAFAPPTVVTGDARYQATLLVTTPAGHAHVTRFDIRLRAEPPPVDLSVETPFGSRGVQVSGRTAPHATVRVEGTPVVVNASGRFATSVDLPPWPTEILVAVDDGLGNAAQRSVTGVGWFDYRGLPWVPITATLVAIAGVVLFLRVPRPSPTARRADDDAVLEEMEAD
ncbi:MAG: hypothetical protein M3406_18370 [Chloroflexota bacterium]|nr:hypothetical protein [Chloroflexota bacterium]